MRRRVGVLVFISIFSLSCTVSNMIQTQVGTITPQVSTIPDVSIPDSKVNTPSVEDKTTPQREMSFQEGPILAALGLPQQEPFAPDLTLPSGVPANIYTGPDKSTPFDLEKITNADVIAGLSDEQRKMLEETGFTVVRTQEDQFYNIRFRVSDQFGQPYYLTTDAAYHALHLTFDELLKHLESEALRPRMIDLTRSVLAQILSYLPDVKGTSLESDTLQAAAYFSVALKLLDPPSPIDRRLEDQVTEQLRQIETGQILNSRVVPSFKDDYSAYKPVGHYTGEPNLETYFRAMTWFGRVHFALVNTSDPSFQPSRTPLLITLALRQAKINDEPAAIIYNKIFEILTFIIGPTDDAGPKEYAALMDQIYGPHATIQSLLDEAKWKTFQEHRNELPAPQIHSTFMGSTQENQSQAGWRFLGQRFTLDGSIIQNLLYDQVGSADKRRLKPSGLDVMAAFGSRPAIFSLNQTGASDYLNYAPQMDKLQKEVQSRQPGDWTSSFYNSWLYAFLPQLAEKGSAFPAHMHSSAWGFKELNSSLGAWTELKHDTTLYTKMPEPLGGGGPPASGPAPAYIEPDPDVFYRLSYAAGALFRGLVERGIDPNLGLYPDPEFGKLGLDHLVEGMGKLGDDYKKLGAIAAKELAGRPPSEDDTYLIQSCLGPVECLALVNVHMGEMPVASPIPLIATVSGAGNGDVLVAATGKLGRIYTVIYLENKFQVAQGGVFSYYEFTQPRNDRLTDEAWRKRLDQDPPQQPAWVSNFLKPDGESKDALAFRVKDVYKVNQEGAGLNFRSNPSTNSEIQQTLLEGAYLQIIDGPLQAEGYTWWKVQIPYDGPTGWVVENPTWFDRAYGQ